MPRRSTFLLRLSLLGSLLCCQPASAQEPIFFEGTGNFYALIQDSGPLSWEEANVAATQLSFGGVQGHLATVTSAAENQFLADTFNEPAWIGLFQELGAAEPDEGFQWVTGEAFDFENFGISEPNNSSGDPDNPNERFVEFNNEGFWNDLNSDNDRFFFVEFTGAATAVPEPASGAICWAAMIIGGLRRHRIAVRSE